MSGNTVVVVVALLTWGLLWVYLIRLERRIKNLEIVDLRSPEPPMTGAGTPESTGERAMAEVPKFYKNPATATVLSFFFMGLGQIYNGQIGKGVLFIVLYSVSLCLMWIIIGFVTTPILWIWGMIDANNSAKRINHELAR